MIAGSQMSAGRGSEIPYMRTSDLPGLFRELEAATLERSLRLVAKAFFAQTAGIYAVKADKDLALNVACPAAVRELNPAALLEMLLEAPPGELVPLDDDRVRCVCLNVSGGRALFWLEIGQGWNRDAETAFPCVAHYLARSPDLLEKVSAAREVTLLDQRLADASHFAGRVAHDFDNILTGVVGFADLGLMQLAADSALHEYLREIRAAGSRGLVFTQQLHHLSRSGVVKAVPTGVAGVMRKEKERLPDGSKVQFDLPAGLPEVALEGNLLQLVVSSLIDNAMQATKEGLVSVTFRLVELAPAELEDFLGSPLPGPHVEVLVRDNGVGIREDIRPRLFHEPFVTTKAKHRGLGLPICYRILRAHRAGIRLESLPGRGTTARVVVPLAAARQRNSSATIRETARIGG